MYSIMYRCHIGDCESRITRQVPQSRSRIFDDTLCRDRIPLEFLQNVQNHILTPKARPRLIDEPNLHGIRYPKPRLASNQGHRDVRNSQSHSKTGHRTRRTSMRVRPYNKHAGLSALPTELGMHNGIVHPLILRQLEYPPRSLTRVDKRLDLRTLPHPRVNDMVACNPDTIVTEYPRSPELVVRLLHPEPRQF